ncbi:hypothetical protein AYL99_11289 [Fonsecaea erecta]|uniref:Uncharacterized protein n=1 Tax=Fonsecaea erecta TaxID=1367422 RepID=A0A178Z5P5_9EURO|nr:hypothetical protein AYL99_11289 [Fonsecaea erecta]OAP54841.1 hypothetical protein AYL99_11289 [Fonsecaea erecta]
MSPLHSFLILAGVLLHTSNGYVDFGSLTLPIEPMYQPTPRPNQLPGGIDLRYEILPSMITAVAPSVTIATNGTHQTMYSLHYHHYFSKTRQGRGVFDKRGVFASDPPIATCTPCGGGSVTSTPSGTTTSTVPCTTLTYHGVFDFPPTTTTASCYDTNYSGVFQSSTASTSGLPCCFTIPASCRMNSTMSATTSTSFMASTGVFRSTTTSTTTTISSTIHQRNFLSVSRRDTQQWKLIYIHKHHSHNYQWNHSGHHHDVHFDSGVHTHYNKHGKLFHRFQSALCLAVTVNLLEQRLQLVRHCHFKHDNYNHKLWDCHFNWGKRNIIFLIYANHNHWHCVERRIHFDISLAYHNNSAKYHFGTGTVYLGDTRIVTSGTASGFASNVYGCGTIIATSGTFTGSAEITGCGSGSGTGTLTGTGTVWPAYGGGLISLVTSGTVSGSGNFSGCGILTGSGTFMATTGSPVVISPSTTPTPTTTSRPIKTVSVYLSYCPDPMGANDILRLAGDSNKTSSSMPNGAAQIASKTNSLYSSSSSNSNTTLPANNSTDTNPLCQTCPNSVGVCCPPTVRCAADDGKCPLYALENSGNTINGYLIAQVMNSSAPVAGRKKVRALEKKQQQQQHHKIGSAGEGQDDTATAKGFGGKDLLDLEAGVERQLQRHKEKKRAHRKQF